MPPALERTAAVAVAVPGVVRRCMLGFPNGITGTAEELTTQLRTYPSGGATRWDALGTPLPGSG